MLLSAHSEALIKAEQLSECDLIMSNVWRPVSIPICLISAFLVCTHAGLHPIVLGSIATLSQWSLWQMSFG